MHFDDDGPDFDWSITSLAYRNDLGLSWIETLAEASGCESEKLNLPNVDISLMNGEQRFAFNIAMQTLLDFLKCTDVNFQSQLLRMVVKGTAESGKSFLINCLVKAISSSANIVGGTTLHRFFKFPIYKSSGEMKIHEGSIGASLVLV